MKRIEALGMSIAREHEAFEPGSEAFQTLNPGLLRSYLPADPQSVNENGVRIFSSFQAGWQTLLNNLQAKCGGIKKANGVGALGPDSSLNDLTRSFCYLNVRHIVEFLQDALSDKAVNEHTKLVFFLEGSNGNSHSRPSR